MRRWLLSVFTVLVLTSVAAEEPLARHDTTRGGLTLGIDYFTSLKSDGPDSFLYPSFGFTHDWKKFYLETDFFLPILFTDFIFGGLGYIAGTNDFVFPMWYLLNDGTDNPGRMKILTATGRYACLTTKGHKLDVGLLMDVWFYTHYVADKRLGHINFDLGLSAGYGLHSKHFSFNLAASIGDGFTRFSSWNPFIGFDATGRVRLGKYVGLYLKLMFRTQRVDFSGYEPPSYEKELSASDFDIARWEPMFAMDGGFFFSVLD